MGRFLAGVASALLLVAAGLFFWRGFDEGTAATPLAALASAPAVQASTIEPVALPRAPSAPPLSREEKRFARYDKDKNGSISSGEYLESRRKAYARLDLNKDGVLQFNEYATKTAQKFSKADGDRSGWLSRAEFAATRVVRKPRPKVDCPPQVRYRQPAPSRAETDADDEA